MGNWNKLSSAWNMRVWIFQFLIDSKIHHKWLEKCYPKDKFNKSTRRICLIYFSIAPFIDYIKFPLWNMHINNLMLINFHISLMTERFLRSFDRHSDKIVALSELLPNINKFEIKYWIFSESFMNVASKLFELLWYMSWIPLFRSRNALQWIHTVLLQRMAELSPPSYILYTLLTPLILPPFSLSYFIFAVLMRSSASVWENTRARVHISNSHTEWYLFFPTVQLQVHSLKFDAKKLKPALRYSNKPTALLSPIFFRLHKS